MNVRLTRRFAFEMAHALHGYDGPCRNIHGHSYVLEVSVAGIPLEDASHPKNGMVLDFAEMKRLVHEHILSRVDHSLVLSDRTSTGDLGWMEKNFGKVITTPFQPTCENLLIDIVIALKKLLPPEVQLVRVKLQETASAWAEWQQADNS